jgi:hypothetical protein
MALHHLSPISLAGERETAVLRLLGRVGMLPGQDIIALLCPDLHPSNGRRLLIRLVKEQLLWQGSVPHHNRDSKGRSRGRPFNIYGLTESGKQMLDMTGVEPHDGTYERLIARSRQRSEPLAAFTRAQDIYIAQWCAALFQEIRRLPTLVGVHAQRRYAVIDNQRHTLQTIGMLIVLAFDPTVRHFDRRLWDVPWLSLALNTASWRYVRLGLEVDLLRVAPHAVFDIARAYRHLNETGVYQQVLGGAVQPVMVTHGGQQARAVAEVWMGAWPGSNTLLSTFPQTSHPLYGPLWGDYLMLSSDSPTPTRLLGSHLSTVERWATIHSQWETLLAKAPQPES